MSLEALLLLFSAYGTGTTLSRGTWSVTITPLSGYLNMYLLGLFGFLAVFLLERYGAHQRTRFFVIAVTTSLTLLMIALPQIHFRKMQTAKYLNDSLVQSVEAAKGVLHGQNPYTMDFGTTAFRIFVSASGGDPSENIARQHYVYPPLQFLILVPFVWLEQSLHVFIDYPTLFLILLFCIVWLLTTWTPSWRKRTMVVLLTIGNPFLWINIIAGNNDTLLAALLLVAAWAWMKKKYLLGGIGLGLALAAKQTAWLALPLWGYWLWRQYRAQHITRRTLYQTIATTLGAATLLYAPYMIWNFGAMYDDMVRYLSGAISGSLPISGFTVAQYLHIFHIVGSPWTTASILPLTLPAIAIILWIAIRRLRQQHEVTDLLGFSAATFLVAILFNRMGSDNYLIPVFLLGLGSYMAREQPSVDHV